MSAGPHERRVLILFPSFNSYAFGESWKEFSSIAPPLGPLYLASRLRKDGYEVAFIDFNVDRLERENYAEIVRRQGFILISCYTRCLEQIKHMIRDIRSMNPEAVILCGGPHCNFTGSFFEGSDVTVVGEAEQRITEILERSLTGDLGGIPGLIYRRGTSLERNEGVLAVEDMDRSELPLRELARDKKYGNLYGVQLGRYTTIQSSRGCPFDCSFCTSKGPRYRERSIENVMAEIRMLYRQGIRYFGFCDENFVVNRKRTLALMDRIIMEKMKVGMLVQARVDSADAELYRKMKQAGVIVIMYGIESIDDEVLKYYDKNITRKDIERAVSLANQVGFIIIGQFIVGAPMETRRHFALYRLSYRRLAIDVISLGTLTYYYRSKLWIEARRAGIIRDDLHTVEADSNTSRFSNEELSVVKKDIMDHFYGSMRRKLRLVYKCLKNLDMNFLLTVIKVLVRNDYKRKISEIINTL